MPQIKAITDEMLERAGKIRGSGEELGASHDGVLSVMQNMGADFSGKLPTAMLELMLSQKDKYAAVGEAIKDYGDFVEHAANTYEWTDKEIARWAEKLGKDGARLIEVIRPEPPDDKPKDFSAGFEPWI
ncbi:MAG: hypothetical protein LBF92_00950 [Synergistaceae bacterium]|jgi:uncharacterized protein YukE|nr:hypothetical protein [Synergistaceae bacterium]